MFYIIDQGARIQTPLESLLRARKVNALEKTGAISAIGTDQLIQEQPKPSPPHISTSYQEAEKHHSQEREAAIFAKQIMTHPVIAIDSQESILSTWKLFKQKRFHHLPILNDRSKLCGIITDRDLMRFQLNNIHTDIASLKIQQIMSAKLITAGEQTEIRSIADVMCKQAFSAMPITDEQQKLIGIVSRTDILRTFVNQEKLEMWV